MTIRVLEIAAVSYEKDELVFVQFEKDEWYTARVLAQRGDKLKVMYKEKNEVEVLDLKKNKVRKNASQLVYKSFTDREVENDSGPVKADVEALERKILKYRKAYYDGNPLVSDKEYDLLEDKLRELAPNSKVFKMVGADVFKKIKVPLPYPMWSLDKVRPQDENVQDWIDSHDGPYIVSDKIDGVSLLSVYSGSKPTKLYTRGKGNVGGDISFLTPYLKHFVKLKGKDLVVRSEGVLYNGDFKARWGKDFENPRNMAAGITNRKDVHPGLKDLHFIAHEVYVPRMKPSVALKKLKALGFEMVPHIVVPKLTEKFLSDYLKQRKAKARYDIDGLVVSQDKPHPISKNGNPDFMVAFKEMSEDSIAQVKVKEVRWDIARTGYIKPVVVIEPVRLSGVTINHATAHNAKYVKDNRIGPGAVIKLTRSGDVIPYILEVVKPASKAQMPSKSEFPGMEWNKTGVDLFVPNAHKKFESVDVQRIANFFSVMGIESIKEGVVQKLYDAGMTSIVRILRASIPQLMEAEGVQEKLATKIRRNIDEAIKDAYMPTVMDASGCFDRGIGTRRAEAVQKVYPDMLKLIRYDEKTLVKKILEVPGFKDITAIQFAKGLPRFAKWVAKTPITFERYKAPVKKSSKLEGQVIVFTGFRDSDLEKEIKENGGEVGSGVSSRTTILLVADKGSGSSKLVKARQMGIAILTAKEFRNKWL